MGTFSCTPRKIPTVSAYEEKMGHHGLSGQGHEQVH